MRRVWACKPAGQTSDKTTTELLTLAISGGPLDDATVGGLAEAIDAGHFARTAVMPDHEAVRLDLSAEAIRRMVGMFELVRRATAGPPPSVIRRPADVAAVAQRELGGRVRECVLVIVCDAANAVIGTEIVSRGAVDRALLPVREILVATMRADGKAFAVAHNHPSRELAASESDISATESLATAARTVGLRFLGHTTVGRRLVSPRAPRTPC